MIPSHNCKNCGACCGPVPISMKEFHEIVAYVKKHKPKYNKNNDNLTCKFRVDGRCSIYSVRPILCRLFGVTHGLNCINGNQFNINGRKYLDPNVKVVGLLNDSIRTNY